MDILELLHYTFFQHALLGSLFASIACGIIGTYIVTRRLVFISGGITHASFGGIGLGLYAGISPLLSAAIFSVLSSFGVEWLSKRKDMREDSAIAVFWTFGMAVGIIFSFRIHSRFIRLSVRQHSDHYAHRYSVTCHSFRAADTILHFISESYHLHRFRPGIRPFPTYTGSFI